MNWVRQDLRLAIYMRDGFRCLYCGASQFLDECLSLDHLCAGADNSPANLATACISCNVAKGEMGLAEFVGEDLAESIRRAAGRPVDRLTAAAVLVVRGSASRAVAWLSTFRMAGGPHGAESDWR